MIEVTTLADSGPGSLRAALEAAGPRVVVFRVGGRIELRSPLRIAKPFVTVAGQSAPGGIELAGGSVAVEASDVVFRAVRLAGVGLEGSQVPTLDRVLVLDRSEPGRLRSPTWPAATDSDHDGMSDAWERVQGFNPHDPADGPRDPDKDGLTNVDEFLEGTDPRPAQPVDKAAVASPAAAPALIGPEMIGRQVAYFNAAEPEDIINAVPNADAAAWMQANIPRFDCPDADLTEIYYFRWWSLRKHLRRDAQGRWVFTEFINKPQPVSSSLGLQLMEGRWLRDASLHDNYVDYWLHGPDGKPQPHLHKYSQWLPQALWQRALVTGDTAGLVARLDALIADHQAWIAEKRRPDGLFWQHDVWDAMEESIGGGRKVKNVRPTINSYMAASALALADIARLAGRTEEAARFTEEGERLRADLLRTLWNPESSFFEVVRESGGFVGAREAIGFIPWYFSLPPPNRGYEQAWAQFSDDDGFRAPFGITTAERRHPEFRSHGIGTCEWDGAVWPFATSQTLTALANVLRDYPGAPVTKDDYFASLLTYARSHRFDGQPYIGEYLDETTGYWLKGRHPRSRWYHHSTFADLVIAGVVGLRPRGDDVVEVSPLLPEGRWDWFCLEGVRYRGRDLTIIWDREGTRYGRGAGLSVWADGRLVVRGEGLAPLSGKLL